MTECGLSVKSEVAKMEDKNDPKGCQWNPYTQNGGTVIGFSGKDFCIIGASCRMTSGSSVISRTLDRFTQLTPKCFIASAGMQAECVALHKLLKIRVAQYYHTFRKEPSVHSLGWLLSHTLYQRRFFPFFAFNILGGVDENGKGVLYDYDGVGNIELKPYACTGTGSPMVLPIIDSAYQQCGGAPLSISAATQLLMDSMVSVAERDVNEGDQIKIVIVDASGVRTSTHPTRND